MTGERKTLIVSLGELAKMPGLPSEPTIRKDIETYRDFPLVSRGKNGVAYEVDLFAAIDFYKGLKAREEEAERARADELRQHGFDLLGEDSALDLSQQGLTASERRALLEAEFVAIRLGKERGDYVPKASVEAAFSAVFQLLSMQRRKLTQRLAKRAELSREQVAVMDSMLERDLHELVDKFEELGGKGDAASVVSANTAV